MNHQALSLKMRCGSFIFFCGTPYMTLPHEGLASIKKTKCYFCGFFCKATLFFWGEKPVFFGKAGW